MERIYVWVFDETMCGWVLRSTEDLKETQDEYKYFRVIRDGVKQYYNNETDHFYHMTSGLNSAKKISVWSKDDNGNWTKNQTDLTLGTGDERGLYTYNNGKNKQYYYSYYDFLEHQCKSNTFYKN